MRNETAEAKKGTWKEGRRCTQAKGTERRQSQGDRRLRRAGDSSYVHQSPVVANQSEEEAGRMGSKGRKRRIGAGGSQL